MKFSEIVNGATALIQSSSRVSHRALKREYELDDETLADLIDELVEVRRVAYNEDGRILVSTADGVDALTPITRSNRDTFGVEESLTIATRATANAAERRQLTVMFCDIVGSTELSRSLDPETMRELIRAYQQCVGANIERFEGYIAQYLGDGLLIYFGFPQAHEDDAVRGVCAALDIVAAIQQLNASLPQPLRVRISLHTGEVVIGDLGHGSRTEQLAVGEVPNIAAALQQLAAPGEIIISAATQQLIDGQFDCEARPAQTLKDSSEQVKTFIVLRAGDAQNRFDVAVQVGLNPVIGRDAEIDLLRHRWQLASQGSGQIVLLCGEPGIGKSRLVKELKDELANRDTAQIEFRCSPYHQNSALRPITEHLQRLLNFGSEENGESKLKKLRGMLANYEFQDDHALTLLARLLSLPDPPELSKLNLNSIQQKQRSLAVLTDWLGQESERQPVYVSWEDLHWADPSTLELLNLLLQQIPSLRLLAVLSFRPEFIPDWPAYSYQSQITLTRLSPSSISKLVLRISKGKTLPTEIVDQIIAKTDGVPLFVEELTKMILESSLLVEAADGYELEGPIPMLAIPSTLHDSLMARLDRSVEVRETAQLGATIGREFSFKLLSAVSELNDGNLDLGLRSLVEAELIYQRGVPPVSRYVFKHALIQDAAYQSLLKGTRQQLHAKIAQTIERLFPEIVATEPEILALHYTGAGMNEQAIAYWKTAGERAVERSANREAIDHLNNGLKLIADQEPSTDRDERELTLRAQLGPALIAAKGYGAEETASCFERARELTRTVRGSAVLFPVLYGCWVYKLAWAEFPTVRTMAEEFLQLALEVEDSGAILTGHRILGFSQSCLGEFTAARKNFEQVRALYSPREHTELVYRYGQDPNAAGTAMLAWNLWHLGYPDQAVTICEEAVMLAQQINHSNTRGYVETFGAARIQLMRRDKQGLSRYLDSMTRLCQDEKLIFWSGFIEVFRGWLTLDDGQPAAAVDIIKAGLNELEDTSTAMFKPHCFGILAEAYLGCARYAEALETIDEALAVADNTAEHWVTPELLRLKGEILCAHENPRYNPQCARQYFEEALNFATIRDAKSWQLRIAISLARLDIESGNRSSDAMTRLGQLYDGFSEGFTNRDLLDAKALLNQHLA